MSSLLPTSSQLRSRSPNEGQQAPTDDKRASRELPRTRRRNRLITSCLECRRRKLKCDKQQPCVNCTKLSRSCVFIQVDPQAQAKLAEVKEKMGMLERTLEEEAISKGTSKSSTRSPSYEAPVLPGQEPGYSDQEEEEDVKGLDPNELVVQDASYYEDDDNDDTVDLGISMGKLRITDRIGGMVRPRFAEELAAALQKMPEDNAPNPFASGSPRSWMSPGSDYVAPLSSFFFGPNVDNASLLAYLPSKVLVDKLLVHYWQVVHVIVRTVHRPSFERHYQVFWKNVRVRLEPRPSFQALLFAMLLSSIISMSEEKVLMEFRVDKQSLVDNFRQGTDSALARANLLQTTKLETLQAFVTYLLPLCRAEVSRAHSALAGTCIRLAECMGLHRDPTSYTKNPVEIQVRRLIWFQIAFLDLRTSEAIGPRPQIRRDEYDTHFPLNVDDEELERAAQSDQQVIKDSKHFTAMTITRMRLECYEMYRFMWTERPKLEKRNESGEKKTTLTSLLSRIQAFTAGIEKTYLPMMSKSNPQHVAAMEMYGILSSRLYVMLLHPFASNDKRSMPERLRQIMLSSCIMIVEHTMNIESQPALAQYSWYVGALHQYHSSLLLMSEMYVTPPDPVFSDRAWKCLDYTFDLPAGLGPHTKGRMVLSELARRTSAYASVRGLRAPTAMPHAGSRDLFSDETGSTPQKPEFGLGSQDTRSKSPYTQHQQSPPENQSQSAEQAHLRPYNPGTYPIKGPTGSMPQTDWGAFDLAAHLPPATESPFNFASHVPTAAARSQEIPSNPFAGMSGVGADPDNTSLVGDTNTDTRTGTGAGMGNDVEASPMEAALNDIDWNEWDRLFGAAGTGDGNLMIPPFTFPRFELGEAQWGEEGRGGGMQ
ncbi:hypothetical protein P280DRAFT_498255 [Massarina eburnea CBS 473.64]|uniref:Zn(2)-C6 fungal-type domain-containing protein n=1 Tax=Massarina eburnea CBS 473.64 TaxID=1395130 RepID=A0A6A6S3Z9_9PLEO|nr:hypothetical protein P280DRAFT_498255 [Massarina eburnea CBS 473.64]